MRVHHEDGEKEEEDDEQVELRNRVTFTPASLPSPISTWTPLYPTRDPLIQVRQTPSWPW